MKRILIDLTYDCNMKCPWCVARYVGAEDMKGPMPPEAYEKLMNHLKDTKYDLYTFHGGEPTLYPELLKQAVCDIRDMQPEAKMMLYTNGTRLTPQLVRFLNDKKIHVWISLEAEGYKGLLQFMQYAEAPEDSFKNIQELKSVDIRVVVCQGKPFAYQALLLHNIFPLISVNIVPDYTTLNELALQDIAFMRAELERLKRSAPNYKKWSGLMQGFKHSCSCVDKFHFYLATEEIATDPQAETGHGCSFFRRQMGGRLYDEYQKLCSDFYGGESE